MYEADHEHYQHEMAQRLAELRQFEVSKPVDRVSNMEQYHTTCVCRQN